MAFESKIELPLAQLPQTDGLDAELMQTLEDIFNSFLVVAVELTRQYTIRTVTAAVTLEPSDVVVIVDAGANIVPVTLYSAVGYEGYELGFKCTDASFAPTVVPAGSETIDGTAGAQTLTLNEYVRIKSDGTNWIIIT